MEKFMRCVFLICFCIIMTFSIGKAQEKIYELDTKKDLLISGIGLGLNIIGYTWKTEGPTIEGINGLNENDLWSIDRSAIYNKSQKAQTISDILLYSSMTIPFAIYSDKRCRSEGFAIGLMGLETFLITNGITTITKAMVERYRPFTYNPDVSLDEKLSSRSRLSFFSGHTSATTGLSFFATKVLIDLNPNSKNKWLFWTIGATTPALMGYLRYEAGKHFLTDVITGYALGAAVGYLIPTIHKNKNINLGIGFAGTLDFKFTF